MLISPEVDNIAEGDLPYNFYKKYFTVSCIQPSSIVLCL